MADTTNLSRAGRDQLLKIIAEQEAEIKKLCAPELAKRDARITELQAEMSEMVENSFPRRVRAFQKKFGHPVEWTPRIPDKEQMQFRLNLISEEFLELLKAAGVPMKLPLREPEIDFEKSIKLAISMIDMDKFDFPEFVDAQTDLDWVNEGTRATMGTDRRPVEDAVSKANMAKDPEYVAIKDAHHRDITVIKPSKPPGWEPPDIEAVLVKQGWRKP